MHGAKYTDFKRAVNLQGFYPNELNIEALAGDITQLQSAGYTWNDIDFDFIWSADDLIILKDLSEASFGVLVAGFGGNNEDQTPLDSTFLPNGEITGGHANYDDPSPPDLMAAIAARLDIFYPDA